MDTVCKHTAGSINTDWDVPAILKCNLENKPQHSQCQDWNLETSLFLYDMRGQLTWLAPIVKEDD